MADTPHLDTEKISAAFAEAGREIGKALGGLTLTITAQSALAHSLNGNEDEARASLAKLTLEQRSRVARAADRLAELARES